jgi:hypothetical protein
MANKTGVLYCIYSRFMQYDTTSKNTVGETVRKAVYSVLTDTITSTECTMCAYLIYALLLPLATALSNADQLRA